MVLLANVQQTSAAREAQVEYGVSLGLSIFCLTSTYVTVLLSMLLLYRHKLY